MSPVEEQKFAIKISATGEVRDAEGNLVSSEPVEASLEVTADELARILGEDS